MKKIISAEKQWRDEMNALINEGNVCNACCDGLGAVGDNECYDIFCDAGEGVLFTKVGDKFEKIYYSDVSEEYLLANNWQKLNPDEDWYDHKAVMQFLIDDAKGKQPESPIEMRDLLWMGIFTDGDDVRAMPFEDKEVEVYIEAIRKEIVERCKGHSIEEVRDMFDGYNWGESGEDTFDFEYKGFVFSVCNKNADKNSDYSLYLSTVVYTSDGAYEENIGKVITLPIPPKEIKIETSDIVDEKPDLSRFKSFTTVSYECIVEKMRESCIYLISDLYQMIGDKYVEIDLTDWRAKSEHCYFAEYHEGYAVALTRNDKGDVVLTGTDADEWDEYMTNNNWSFVSLEEMLYIINQLTSK